MELNGLAFVLKCTEGEDNNSSITAEFVRDGKEKTLQGYSQISYSLREKIKRVNNKKCKGTCRC